MRQLLQKLSTAKEIVIVELLNAKELVYQDRSLPTRTGLNSVSIITNVRGKTFWNKMGSK